MTAQSEQILRFLKEMDAQTKTPFTLYLIGGGAVTLAYDPKNRTADLDFIDPPDPVIALGGKESPLAEKYHVYISSVTEINFSVPADWKKRCHPLDLSLKQTQIMVPCVEDIVLGKMARLEPKDFEDIFGLKEQRLLTPKKLLQRLQENKKELKNFTYRNNAKLLFREVFQLKLHFQKGIVRINSS